MKKKKVMLSLAAAAMVGTLAVGGTLAWFTDTETATNVVTTGDVDIIWNEGGKDIVGDETGLDLGKNQVPGASIDKDALIKNVGVNNAYVRAKIYYQIGEGEKTEQKPEGYDVDIQAGQDLAWELGEDGYYYFKKVLYAKNGNFTDQTDILVGKVGVSESAGNNLVNQELKVILKAEAVQADNIDKDILISNDVDFFEAVFNKISGDVANESEGLGN